MENILTMDNLSIPLNEANIDIFSELQCRVCNFDKKHLFQIINYPFFIVNYSIIVIHP